MGRKRKYGYLQLIPLTAERATFFTPSMYTCLVEQSGLKTLSRHQKIPLKKNMMCIIKLRTNLSHAGRNILCKRGDESFSKSVYNSRNETYKELIWNTHLEQYTNSI